MTRVLQWPWDNRAWVFSGIGVFALGLFLRWMSGRRARQANPTGQGDAEGLFEKQKRPLELEILPQYFELNLENEVPEIRVFLLTVNYLDSPIKLSTVRVDHFRLSIGTALDGILLVQEGVTLYARRSHQVMCRKVLADSETRTFLKGTVDPRPNASVTLSARGHLGRKIVDYDNSNVWMNGYISRPTRGVTK